MNHDTLGLKKTFDERAILQRTRTEPLEPPSEAPVEVDQNLDDAPSDDDWVEPASQDNHVPRDEAAADEEMVLSARLLTLTSCSANIVRGTKTRPSQNNSRSSGTNLTVTVDQ